jgi:hypothetical protein
MSKKFDVNAIVSERKNELDSSPLFQSKPEPAKPVKPASSHAAKKAVKKAVKYDSVKSSIPASRLANNNDTIETIRKAVKRTGEKVTYIRLTKEEKSEMKDIVYTYEKQGIETSENEIGRISLKWLIEDYKENGQNSILAKVLAALND